LPESAPFVIPSETTLFSIDLTVSNIERALDFYTGGLGLVLHNHDRGNALLGSHERGFLHLTELPGAVKPHRHSGLYHFAILLPDRVALAASLRNLFEQGYRIQGASDHLVSEALYLADPDGNGIELYRDRKRWDWRRINGQLQMAVDPLDLDRLLSDAGPRQTATYQVPDETRLGHVHLHVGDLQTADFFYSQGLGFEKTFEMPGSAFFYAAGGYHHHLAVNIWNGQDAPPQPDDAIGMRRFSITLPGQPELEQLRGHLNTTGIGFTNMTSSIETRDPAGNRVALTAGPSSADRI
jgi:catechol 2,3-dioxygenase